MLDRTPGSLLRDVDSKSRCARRSARGGGRLRRGRRVAKCSEPARHHLHERARSVKARFEKVIRTAQDSICKAIEEIDGTKFREDAWVRAGGGGGITRVMQNGNVWEKAGVNVSVVYGTMPPEAYRCVARWPGEGPDPPRCVVSSQQSSAMRACPYVFRAATALGADALKNLPKDATARVPFFAAGISSVMHPHNPHAPTMHFNYRYFETEEWAGIPGQWWFGGGTGASCLLLEGGGEPLVDAA